MRVKVSNYNSEYFPVRLDWEISGIKYFDVFENDQQASDYIFGRYGNNVTIIDTREKPKRKTYFKPGADIPKTVRNKTYYNMKKYHLDLYDAFSEAIRSTPNSEMPKELVEAWYFSDLRNYIPSAYIQ